MTGTQQALIGSSPALAHICGGAAGCVGLLPRLMLFLTLYCGSQDTMGTDTAGFWTHVSKSLLTFS